MSDFEDLEEIADQTSKRVNKRAVTGKRGWGIGPNVERSSAHVEHPLPPPAPKAAPIAVPEAVVPNPGEIIAVVRTLQDAVDVFRLMKERWGLTNEFVDDVGLLASGHTDKCLGPTEDKRLGYDTFALFCELFAVEFHARIDMAALKRMEAVWEKRKQPLWPNSKTRRISKKLIERAKPHVYRDSGRAGGNKRAACLPAKQAARISRKGGKSRAKSLSKQRRREIARAGGLAKAARRRDIIAAAAALAATALPAPLPGCGLLEYQAPSV